MPGDRRHIPWVEGDPEPPMLPADAVIRTFDSIRFFAAAVGVFVAATLAAGWHLDRRIDRLADAGVEHLDLTLASAHADHEHATALDPTAGPLVAMDEMERVEGLAYDIRLWRVVRAMDTLARSEDCNQCSANGLTARWGGTPAEVAEAILVAADRHGLDPLIMVAMAWRESRFDPRARGDSTLGEFVLSCGPTQIRVDFPGRPSCDDLRDVRYAFDWTARHLMRDGELNLPRWNGDAYALEVFHDVAGLRAEVGQ